MDRDNTFFKMFDFLEQKRRVRPPAVVRYLHKGIDGLDKKDSMNFDVLEYISQKNIAEAMVFVKRTNSDYKWVVILEALFHESEDVFLKYLKESIGLFNSSDWYELLVGSLSYYEQEEAFRRKVRIEQKEIDSRIIKVIPYFIKFCDKFDYQSNIVGLILESVISKKSGGWSSFFDCYIKNQKNFGDYVVKTFEHFIAGGVYLKSVRAQFITYGTYLSEHYGFTLKEYPYLFETAVEMGIFEVVDFLLSTCGYEKRFVKEVYLKFQRDYNQESLDLLKAYIS